MIKTTILLIVLVIIFFLFLGFREIIRIPKDADYPYFKEHFKKGMIYIVIASGILLMSSIVLPMIFC